MIYIIRHGQTELNRRQVLQGRSDAPLNETGIAQAQQMASALAGVVFCRVFSSPLRRAVQTARIVAPNVEPEMDERLMTALPPEVRTFFSDFVHNPAPDGMEPLSSVKRRAGSFLENVKRLEGNILISTHAIAMKGILEQLTPESNGSYWSTYIGNCAVYVTEPIDGNLSVPREWVPGTGRNT